VTTLEHQALLYGSSDEFLTATVPYLRAGLATGDFLLAVVPEPGLSALRDSLGGDGTGVGFVDAATWYRHPVQTIKEYNNIVRDQAPRRVRAVAEPVWARRTALDTMEWARYEAVVNVAFARSGARVICAYDRARLPPEVIGHARSTHPRVIENWSAYGNGDYVDPAAFGAGCDTGPLPPVPSTAEYLPIASADDLRAVRGMVARRAVLFELDPDKRRGLITACNEVATNAVKHGTPPMGVWVWREENVLICQVADSGFWRPGGLAGFVPPDSAVQNGFGLWGVRLMTDLVQLRGGWDGTFVRMHVHR
jgi:anti-sigma regulatory factor (Ser/Thr protein kinase)